MSPTPPEPDRAVHRAVRRQVLLERRRVAAVRAARRRRAPRVRRA
ncbi:hypothetical protein [Nocardioides mangrovi]|nr:hypothetical protein [Nocardioides mangrovi]